MKNCIITISREYGSGGRDIGRKLAEELGLPLFDKEIMHMALERSGMSEDFVEKHNDSVPNKFMLNFYRLALNVPSVKIPSGFNSHVAAASALPAAKNNLTDADKLFNVQATVIREIASNGGCVIVGRCAGYILRNNPSLLSVFIQGKIDDRIKRTVEIYGRAEKDAFSEVKKIDKSRANYYKLHTGQRWGELQNYDLVINSSYTDIEGAVNVIKAMAEAKK